MLNEWVIERVDSASQIDEVLAIETASFLNPWTRDMYLGELEDRDRSWLFLARDARGRAVGFCAAWRVLDELHIHNVAVEPDSRRQGVAGALLRRAFHDAVFRGARRAVLEVRRSNAVAQQVYGRLGFSIAGVRRAYYTAPEEDALILWCDDLGGRSHQDHRET